MKLSRLLLSITTITCCSLLYVYQQTEIFRVAYVGQERNSAFRDCLDKNTLLRYNINKSTSLVSIDSRVSEYASFEMPQSYRVVKLTHPASNMNAAGSIRPSRLKNMAVSIFGIKRQAEAKTIDRN
ncbi:MAG: hypothetical protein WC301_07265 [Candidatus Omnitrophota bacterium]|jgi:hypothetical protein